MGPTKEDFLKLDVEDRTSDPPDPSECDKDGNVYLSDFDIVEVVGVSQLFSVQCDLDQNVLGKALSEVLYVKDGVLLEEKIGNGKWSLEDIISFSPAKRGEGTVQFDFNIALPRVNEETNHRYLEHQLKNLAADKKQHFLERLNDAMKDTEGGKC